ncbi:MAG: LysR family transcriptional regulator [Thiotrichales bacterium]
MNFHWTLQQLRLFEAVARSRSYTQAAAELHLTQPAVHIQVKRLEEIVGLPLIQKSGKKLVLTRAGEEVYAVTIDVLHRMQQLACTISDMKGHVAGPLKIAAVTSAKFFMPHLLGRFLTLYPDVQPQLKVTNRARTVERLFESLDDLVVIGEVPRKPELAVHPFMENLLVMAAHPGHPLVGRTNLTAADLAHERFLLREPGSGTRAAVETWFRDREVQITPGMELGSSEAIKQAIIANLGISIVPLSSLELELETHRIKLLDVQGFPLRRMWHAVHLGDLQLGLTARVFLDFLIQEGRINLAANPGIPNEVDG